jgi:hypothetical protein
MLYGSTPARHRMGLSARAYRALHQWAREHVQGFSGRHEDMNWAMFDGLTSADLLQLPSCGHSTVDEIARALKAEGRTLPGHAAAASPVTLTRGSRVYLAGRTRPMVVADFAPMGQEVLLRLRSDD